MHRVTKTYGHELGLSACFRQWRAESHCHFLHGYPLSFKFIFEAKKLDSNNWVLDFGGMKAIKAWLVDNFDHRLIIADDDPQRELLQSLGDAGVADTLILPHVGCEAFAYWVFGNTITWLGSVGHLPRVRLIEVEVREHGGNSGSYRAPYIVEI